MYEEDYDEEEQAALDAEENVSEDFSETLTFKIDVNATVQHYIKSAVEKLVASKVDKVIEKRVNDEVKRVFEETMAAKLEEIVVTGFSTPVNKYDYSGNVVESKSMEDITRAIIEDMVKQGSQFKLTWHVPGGYGGSNKTGTISEMIGSQVALMIGERLKPQFEAIEKDFKEKSQAALREYAVAAVDRATQRVLGGGR